MILHPEYYSGSKAKSEKDRGFQNSCRALGDILYHVNFVEKPATPLAFSLEDAAKVASKLKTKGEQGLFVAMAQDINTCRFLLNAEIFRKKNEGRVHVFGSKFLKALSRMDVELRPELLPPRFTAYFAFKDDVLADRDGDKLIGAYVIITPISEFPSDKVKGTDLMLHLTVVPESGVDLLTFGNPTSLTVGLTFGQKFSDVMTRFSVKSDEAVFRTIVNAVMYLHSLSPDVTHLKPVRYQTSREQRDTRRSGMELNNSPYDMVYVSWNYGKDIVYSKDSTVVRTHLRWQPCGPAFSQTKLIMVQEHERHFKTCANLELKNQAQETSLTE